MGLVKKCKDCLEEKPVTAFYKKGGKQKHVYRSICKSCHKASSNKWDKDNPEKRAKIFAKWRKANLDVMAAHQAVTRSKRLQRYVEWADQQYISDLYSNSKEATEMFGVPFEVDHIIPLQGKRVSGLHHEDNLQVLPKNLNRSKGNLWT
jgi:5-methylcytosine-specific restriction endonuclease McrA